MIERIAFHPYLAAMLLLPLVVPFVTAQAGDALAFKNPGLEEPYAVVHSGGKGQITGRIASGWQDNSGWADVTVEYAPDTQNVHEGKCAQRIDVKAIRSGAVQFTQHVSLVKNHVYALSVWLKGTDTIPVSLILRQAAAPYTAYFTKVIALTPEWHQVSLVGAVKKDTDAYVMVNPSAPCTMWVDDASFEDVTSKVSTAPVRSGNLLPGGSFEAGLMAGWSARVWWTGQPAIGARSEFADPRAVLDDTTAADGRRSVKVVIPEQMAAIISAPLVPYNYGRPHSLSVALKANKSVPVQLEMAMSGASFVRSFNVTPQWQRYSFTDVLPYGERVRVRIRCWSGGVTLWCDAAQLEESPRAAPEYHPQFPVELGLRLPRPGSVVFDGESAVVTVVTAGSLPAGAALRLRQADLYGDTFPLPAVKLPAERCSIPPDSTHPRGVFRLRGEVVGVDGQALSAPVSMVFVRLPRPRELAPEQSFFGVHIPLAPEYFAIARAVGARWTRIHDASAITKWPIAEPARGEFQFFDAAVDAARAAGLRILGMLDGAPAWASVKPREQTGYMAQYNHPDAPDAKEQWGQYVRTVVGHYRGKIDAWEVWNEPWGDTFSPGSPELYGELLKLARPAAREANPDATLVGVDAYRGYEKFTETALRVAGTDSFDAFSYHDYNASLYGGPHDNARQQVEMFQAAMRRCGAVKPIWATEGGPGEIPSFYTEGGREAARNQVAHAIRFYVTTMAAGVRRFFYYTLHADPASEEEAFTGLEHDRAIRPELAATAVLASLIDGARCLGRTEPTPGVDAYPFRQTDGTLVTVAWSFDGKTHAMPAPTGTQVLDGLGNPVAGVPAIGAEPVYFVGK